LVETEVPKRAQGVAQGNRMGAQWAPTNPHGLTLSPSCVLGQNIV
jgi:hypothetical protein